MAKKFIDAGIKTEKTAYALGDGTSLTLTGAVRVLYDDTLEPSALYSLLTRIRDRVLEGDAPDA